MSSETGAPADSEAAHGAQPPERRRIVLHWPAVLFIILVWSLLWGNFSIANVVSGLAIAIVVVAVFPLPPILATGRARPIGLGKLLFWFIVDLVAASVEVAWLAIRPGPPPRSAVIAVTLFSNSDLYLTMTSELVTLVPGSVVVDVHRASSTLYVHVIDVDTDEEVAAARERVYLEERRVVEALASNAELATYRELRANRTPASPREESS